MKNPVLSWELKGYSEGDRQRIAKAFDFAAQAHRGQKRRSGKSYITHPVAVAEYLLGLGLDADTVIAGFLHDTVEDTEATLEDIEAAFGPDVAGLVDGVTKLGQVNYAGAEGAPVQRRATSIENVRKLLLAMSRDMRVIMIKLADRRHNLLTLKYLDPEARTRIARESLDIFAPLADRLGMGALKAEIEDASFEYVDPEASKLVQKLVASNAREAKRYIDGLKVEVGELLSAEGIKAESIHARQKHLYSIFRKLAKTDGDITKIYDLAALRIIVGSVPDCYQVLGALHQRYKPLIYRIKDYIAVPKPNGYRSLHTTVFTTSGKIIEIQIRTQEMHLEAEQGLAAHSIYSVHKGTKAYRGGQGAGINAKLSWVQDLAGITTAGDTDLIDQLKVDLFRDRIFVFSPKGDLYDLPEGATPVDFAFAIHSDVGLRVQGAKVNGRIAPLDRPLENRDVVDILTRKEPAPNRQWLNFVKTAGARNRIRAWFRAASRDSNLATGRQLIESHLGTWGLKRFEDVGPEAIKRACDLLNVKDAEALLTGVGEGSISVQTALRRLLPARPAEAPKPEAYVPKKTTGRIEVIGAKDLPCQPAKCCQPEPPVALVGYVTRGSGVTVHRRDCNNIPDESDRLLDCQWESAGAPAQSLNADLTLTCVNRIGLLTDLTGRIAERKINIVKITSENKAGDGQVSVVKVTVEVEDLFTLNSLMRELRDMAEVKSAAHTLIDRQNQRG